MNNNETFWKEPSMNNDETFWKEAKETALFLFDGNTEKAERLLLLIENFVSPVDTTKEFLNLVMNLPEYDCEWCSDNGDCWLSMPDSLFNCNGKCKNFKDKNNDHEVTKESMV